MEQQNYLNDLSVDPVGASQLRDIAKWAKFLSIISFIGCAFIVFAGFYQMYIYSKFSSYGSYAYSATSIGLAIGYLVFAVLWFLPSLFLLQSAVKIRNSLDLVDQQLLNEGLTKLKACFRFWGIMTIIVMAFYAIVIMIALTRL